MRCPILGLTFATFSAKNIMYPTCDVLSILAVNEAYELNYNFNNSLSCFVYFKVKSEFSVRWDIKLLISW